MFECYMVLRPFKWRGWHYGPSGRHIKSEVDETGEPAECDCGHFGGSVFVVETGHPRKSWALDNRKVRSAVELRPTKFNTDDDWVESDPELKKLIEPPRPRKK